MYLRSFSLDLGSTITLSPVSMLRVSMPLFVRIISLSSEAKTVATAPSTDPRIVLSRLVSTLINCTSVRRPRMPPLLQTLTAAKSRPDGFQLGDTYHAWNPDISAAWNFEVTVGRFKRHWTKVIPGRSDGNSGNA